MHPTSRQNFGDGPGQSPKLILTLCLMTIMMMRRRMTVMAMIKMTMLLIPSGWYFPLPYLTTIQTILITMMKMAILMMILILIRVAIKNVASCSSPPSLSAYSKILYISVAKTHKKVLVNYKYLCHSTHGQCVFIRPNAIYPLRLSALYINTKSNTSPPQCVIPAWPTPTLPGQLGIALVVV